MCVRVCFTCCLVFLSTWLFLNSQSQQHSTTTTTTMTDTTFTTTTVPLHKLVSTTICHMNHDSYSNNYYLQRSPPHYHHCFTTTFTHDCCSCTAYGKPVYPQAGTHHYLTTLVCNRCIITFSCLHLVATTSFHMNTTFTSSRLLLCCLHSSCAR